MRLSSYKHMLAITIGVCLLLIAPISNSSLTACGSKFYQRLGLQLLEIEQAIRGDYSFDAVCSMHDQCYSDCVTSREECDDKLLNDAKNICETVADDKEACYADAQIFYNAVIEKGQDAFDQARLSCTDSSAAKIPYFTPSAPPVFCYTNEFIVNELQSEETAVGTKLLGDVFVIGVSDAVTVVKDSYGNTVKEVTLFGKRPLPTSIKEIIIDNNITLWNMFTDPYKCGLGAIVGKCDKRDASQSQLNSIEIIVPKGGDAIVTRQWDVALRHNHARWALEAIDMFISVDMTTIKSQKKADLLLLAGKVLAELNVNYEIQNRKIEVVDLSHWIGALAMVLLNPENIDGRTVFGNFIQKKSLQEVVALTGAKLKATFILAWLEEVYFGLNEILKAGPSLSLLTCNVTDNSDQTRTEVLVDNTVSGPIDYLNDSSLILDVDMIAGSIGFASALILDRSGSMKESHQNPDGSTAQKLTKAKQASKAFILAMSDSDQVSISSFSDKASTQQSMTPVIQIRDKLDSVLATVNPGGATNIGAGLDQGFQQLSNSSSPYKTALLLSDGENNRGDWKSIVPKYVQSGWPVCTIGFGKDADEATLRKIALDTGCTYAAADTFDIVGKYQQLGAYVKGDSMLLVVSDTLAVNGTNIYDFAVSPHSAEITGSTSWQGSRLKTVLVDPSGNRINATSLAGVKGRYVVGDDFQYFVLKNPQPGKWRVETSWAVPPAHSEQVNLLVTEKSDVFSQILSFRPQYKKGESVTVNVVAKELAGFKKLPLGRVSINASVQKPGAQMVRMVEAQSTNWSMYKDVVIDVTRELELYDDGLHDDYKAGDGIFGNTFKETDKQGAYLVTAFVKGQKNNGQTFNKTLRSSFQVGPITQNKVSNSRVMRYMEMASKNIDDSSATSNELFSDPLRSIEELEMETADPLNSIESMQGSDPMDEINRMLRE